MPAPAVHPATLRAPDSPTETTCFYDRSWLAASWGASIQAAHASSRSKSAASIRNRDRRLGESARNLRLHQLLRRARLSLSSVADKGFGFRKGHVTGRITGQFCVKIGLRGGILLLARKLAHEGCNVALKRDADCGLRGIIEAANIADDVLNLRLRPTVGPNLRGLVQTIDLNTLASKPSRQ